MTPSVRSSASVPERVYLNFCADPITLPEPRPHMSRIDRELSRRRLPSYVHNVSTAQCLFCPYGVDGKVGERVYAFDERTVLQHQTRERLVVITAIKIFRSDGARITLDGKPASAFELAQIMQDSKLTLTALLDHRNG